MPRGIPKDPNHPRNKKKNDAGVSAAPKRRGRPPGSKNVAKAQSAAAPSPKRQAAHVTAATVASGRNPHDHLNIVRANIATLSTCGGSVAIAALSQQIEQLLHLTNEITQEDVEQDDAPVAPVTQSVPAPLPSPPSFAPPPFPPHMPG